MNVPFSVFSLLQQEGYDVVRVQDELELGIQDEDIIEHCLTSDRVIVTNDEDFLDPEHHNGVMFLESQRAPPRDVVEAIKRVDELVESEELAGVITYVPDGWL